MTMTFRSCDTVVRRESTISAADTFLSNKKPYIKVTVKMVAMPSTISFVIIVVHMSRS